jgi:ubiquinone/menaquinone biosynthesis C-methylase UbiE
MSSEYNQKLKNQFNNANLASQKIYYTDLYGKLARNFLTSDKILEIGAGAGISSIFLAQYLVERTDYLSWDEDVYVRGGIDAENLPYMDKQFDVVFGVDVLHHLNSPVLALKEISRVLKENGRAIFIEPYVSPMSYFVYKLFHDEKTTYRFNLMQEFRATAPQEGDQGVAKALFCNKKGKKILADTLPRLHIYKKEYLHPLSFFATGGLTKPFRIKGKLIKVLLKLESYIPEFILKLISSRIYIELNIK